MNILIIFLLEWTEPTDKVNAIDVSNCEKIILENDLLYVCIFRLFVWSLSSHSRIFHSDGDVTIAKEGLQILTYAWHSWPLSSEGSLTCHTYCDTGLPFIMLISEDP